MASVRELRELKGLSQVELANVAGVTVATISRLENGHPVNKATLKHISRALGVPLDKITGVIISKHLRKR